MAYTENCDQYHEAQRIDRWVPMNLWGTLWRNCQMVVEKGLVRQRSYMQEGRMAGQGADTSGASRTWNARDSESRPADPGE